MVILPARRRVLGNAASKVAFGRLPLGGIEGHGDHALVELVLEGRNDWEQFGRTPQHETANNLAASELG